MAHVVTANCHDCKYTDCVVVCPVECFWQDEKMLYIDPIDCIDCEACVPECPEGVMFLRVELANTAWKCDLCADCVDVCGTSALWVAETEPAAELTA